ncbi:MAG: GNAT family N-acetyltransferase [Clostridiales bacterium]|nr:GNAT family N-acetyltransferase [Clostridiales bacterium]
MRIVPYEPQYRDELRRVCLQTAFPAEAPNETEQRFTLAMYCDNYLENETAFVLLNESGQCVGYIFCAEDHAAYLRHMEPYLETVHTCGGIYPLMAQAEMGGYQTYAADYPAHLHIDILEQYTGGGNGRLLMETLLGKLREDGVSGVMLQVSAANKRAIAFYEKLGFSRLTENPAAITMGQRL